MSILRTVVEKSAYHDLNLLGFMGKMDGQLEDSFVQLADDSCHCKFALVCIGAWVIIHSPPCSAPSSVAWLSPFVATRSFSPALCELTAEAFGVSGNSN